MGENTFNVAAMAAIPTTPVPRTSSSERDHRPQFQVTDTGEWIDNVFRSVRPSTLYSILIGRRPVALPHGKSTFTSSDILREGTLFKQGSWRKNWKRRYFVLRSDTRMLCYYKSKENLTLLGSIELDGSSDVWATSQSQSGTSQPDYSFAVRGKDSEVLLLCAEDRESMDSWIQDIMAQISQTSKITQEHWWDVLFSTSLEYNSTRNVPIILQGSPQLSETQSPESAQPARRRTDSPAKSLESSRSLLQQRSMLEQIDPERTSIVNQHSNDMDLNAESDEEIGTTSTNSPRSPHTVSKATQQDEDCDSFLISKEGDDDDGEEYEFEEEAEAVTDHRPNELITNQTHNPSVESTGNVTSSFVNSLTDAHTLLVDLPSPPRIRPALAKSYSEAISHATEDLPSPRLNPALSKSKSQSVGESNEHAPVRALIQLQASIKLDSVCDDDDKFFLAMFMVVAQESSSPVLTKRKSLRPPSVSLPRQPLDLVQLGRTEVIKAKEPLADSEDSNTNSIRKQFSVALPHPIHLKCQYVLFQLYRLESQRSDMLSEHELVARCVVPAHVLNHPRSKINMEVISAPVIDISQPQLSTVDCSATLGLTTLASPYLFTLRKHLRSRARLHLLPYAENLYAFPSVDGWVYTLEQLFVSRYTVSVPKAFLHLVLQERLPVVHALLTEVDDELKRAYELLSSIQGSSAAAFTQKMADEGLIDYDILPPSAVIPSPSNLTSGTHMPQLASLDLRQSIAIIASDSAQAVEAESVLFRAVTLVEALRKSKAEVLAVQTVLNEKYTECMEHCERCVQNRLRVKKSTKDGKKGSLISSERGGNYLRRSIWKKSAPWQFCATNLNLQVLHTHKISTSEILAQKSDAFRAQYPQFQTGLGNHCEGKDESSALSMGEKISLLPSLTFGCTAAHQLGFGDGGLKRRLPNDSQDWLRSLQSSGGLTSAFVDMLREQPQAMELMLQQMPTDLDSLAGLIRCKSRLFALAERVDMVIAQALGVAATALHALLAMATLGSQKHNRTLAYVMEAGFLVSVESLLSTQGNELAMLEDMVCAMSLLNTCTIRFVKKATMQEHQRSPSNDVRHAPAPGRVLGVCSAGGLWIRRDDLGGLVLDLEAQEDEIACLKEAHSRRSDLRFHSPFRPTACTSIENDPFSQVTDVISSFPLTAVMFSQGINEMQTVSNYIGESGFQQEVNIQNINRLKEYFESFKLVVRDQARTRRDTPDCSISESQMDAELHRLDIFMEDAENAVSRGTGSSKNVNILLKTSFLCRELSGVNSICCKSGKDRTSMAVTIEQSKHLVEETGVLDGKQACKIFRRQGVRRMNVLANTGQTFYAFNQLQYQCIPKAYRPPVGTYSGKVQT